MGDWLGQGGTDPSYLPRDRAEAAAFQRFAQEQLGYENPYNDYVNQEWGLASPEYLSEVDLAQVVGDQALATHVTDEGLRARQGGIDQDWQSHMNRFDTLEGQRRDAATWDAGLADKSDASQVDRRAVAASDQSAQDYSQSLGLLDRGNTHTTGQMELGAELGEDRAAADAVRALDAMTRQGEVNIDTEHSIGTNQFNRSVLQQPWVDAQENLSYNRDLERANARATDLLNFNTPTGALAAQEQQWKEDLVDRQTAPQQMSAQAQSKYYEVLSKGKELELWAAQQQMMQPGSSNILSQQMLTLFENHAQEAIGLYSTPLQTCLLYTSPSPRDRQKSRMPSSA